MYTAIVELDTLTDTVRTAAQDHYLGLVGGNGVLVLPIVGGIIICAVLGAAYVNTLPVFFYAKRNTLLANLILGNLQQLAQILIREAILFRGDQHLIGNHGTLVCKDRLLFFHQLSHLIDEVSLHLGCGKNLLCGSSLAECLIHQEMSLAGRSCQTIQQFFLGKGIKILRMSKTISSGLQ